MITEGPKLHYWNYFLAIESDLEKLSRYIEFSEDNLNTYSIELAQILLTAASEVDVLLKDILTLMEVPLERNNMYCYRNAIVEHLPGMIQERVYVGRSSLIFQPWDNLLDDKAPFWWEGYNSVKHHRNQFFPNANLQNTLNAVGGLLIVVIYYYKIEYELHEKKEINFRDITFKLQSVSNFISLNSDYYFKSIVG